MYGRCNKDINRNYVKAGNEIWLYLRRYADGEIKYSISNAPAHLPSSELDRVATLRWPIEQCKSNLGMGHYESRSYQGWNHHMLFVMIAHLFATRIRDIFKTSHSTDNSDGSRIDARGCDLQSGQCKGHCALPYT